MNFFFFFFFFNDTATTEIYTTYDTLSLHDALPISAPAENTGGAPVTITTRVPASSRSSAKAAARSRSIGSLSELRRSGRASVTVAIAPSRTSVTLSAMGGRTVAHGPRGRKPDERRQRRTGRRAGTRRYAHPAIQQRAHWLK